jgi:hypothetical protein
MRVSRPITRKSITTEQFRNFIFAGRSIFTLENSETGNYLTFKVKQIKKNYKPVPGQFAVECKSLGDKDYGYRFLGFINLLERTFKNRCYDKSWVGYKTFVWLLKNIERLEEFPKLVIYHEGRCCKCGMPLTVPESIDSGIGPDCKKTMYAKSVEILKEDDQWDDRLSYDENLKKVLSTNPGIWTKVIIPEAISSSKDYRLITRLSALGVFD